MKIKSIQFNIDTSRTINTGMNLRFSYNIPLALPEYDTAIGNNAEVCYIADQINTDLEIEVNLSNIPTELYDKWITIKAVSSSSGSNILGDSDEKLIGITSGGIQGGSFRLKFSNNNIQNNNIGKFYNILDWKYKIKDTDDWIDIASTGHTIYTIPHKPLEGANLWSVTDISSKTTPWVDALDYVCSHFANTNTHYTDTDVREEIANFINQWYFTYTGGSSYSSFDLSNIPNKTIFKPVKFMNDVSKATSTLPLSVNCNDCASINAFLLSLLGIHTDVLYLSMTPYPFTGGFECNEIMSIGSTEWKVPFSGTTYAGSFRYHAVCSSLIAGPLSTITDSCLKVDNDDNPWIPYVPQTNEKESILPFDMVFADPATNPSQNIPIAPYTNSYYRERLCTNPAGIVSCNVTTPSSVLEFDTSLQSSLFIGLDNKSNVENDSLKTNLKKHDANTQNRLCINYNFSLDENRKKREFISIDKLSYTDTIRFENNGKAEISYYNMSSNQEAILLLDNFLNTSSCLYNFSDTLKDLTDLTIDTGASEEKFLAFIKENLVVFINLSNDCNINIVNIAKSIINNIN